ncbi:type VI secretion system protein TssA [Orbaceae bacterium ac157xtp]
MLSQLLSRFFNKQDPDASIRERLNEHWALWLKPISPENPVGEDLTYNDNFQEMKEEVAKLSGIDYALIVSESETILKQQSKDIRVATYYCLAKLQIDGSEGFADGIELLAGMLDKFGNALYPTRNNIRKNAIEWLASNKFIDTLNKLQPINEAHLARIIAALDLITRSNETLFASTDKAEPTQSPDLDGLIRFFANSLKQPIKVHSSEPSAATQSSSNQTVETQPTDNSTIKSLRDLNDQARRMAAFLREKPEGYLAAGRFLRVIRWDTVPNLPPADNRGKTRLAAPRAELKQHINRLFIQQQWRELFERVEVAFMENANHFWLDLQRYAVIALQKMGEPYSHWADIYLSDVGLMLERLKGIERLSFDNGQPFADDDTLHWINTTATIHRLDEDTTFAPIAVSGDNDWAEIEKQALELANNESLEKAFAWLQSLPTLREPKQRYLLQYTQARIAEQVGKTDVAIKLLNGLNQKQSVIRLIDWESSLVFDIKAQLLRLIKQKMQFKESNKTGLVEQIEQLRDELIQLDAARALTVI